MNPKEYQEYRRKAMRERKGSTWVAIRKASAMVNTMKRNESAFIIGSDDEFLGWLRDATNLRQQVYDRRKILFNLEEATLPLARGSEELAAVQKKIDALTTEIGARLFKISQLFEMYMEQV